MAGRVQCQSCNKPITGRVQDPETPMCDACERDMASTINLAVTNAERQVASGGFKTHPLSEEGGRQSTQTGGGGGNKAPGFPRKFDPSTGKPLPKFDPNTGLQNW